MHQHATSALGEVTLNPCQTPPPVPVVTTVAPVPAHQTLYVSAVDCLFALTSVEGTVRWCQQVQLSRTREYPPPPPLMSMPPRSRPEFAIPRVIRGVVYACVWNHHTYTYALDADDGSPRWRTPTDARISSMPFEDWAVPLVKDGIVYSGTYALDERDGAVVWRTPIDTSVEGALALHGLTDETVFASTMWGIYAINTQNGQIRWRYTPERYSLVTGPPVISGRMLYFGTSDSTDSPKKSHLFALDVQTGAEIWRYPMGTYIGAVVDQERIYVHARDRSLSALDKASGRLRWQHPLASGGYYSSTIARHVLYMTTGGADAGVNALRSEDGDVLWHRPLGSGRGIVTQAVVLDGAVYLVRLNQRSGGEIYALDTRDGAECWHTTSPGRVTPHIAVAE